jgi:hypothetical protein
VTSKPNPMPLSGGDYIHDERGLTRITPKAEPAPQTEREPAAAEPTPAARTRTRTSAAAST